MTMLVAGLLAIVVALGPPLHGAAEDLFSAHMVQHLVLVGIAAPLLAAGLPGTTVLMRLPTTVRRPLARSLGRAYAMLHLGAGRMVALVSAWLLHVVTLWAWHVPALYEAALRNPLLHALEHASLLGGATVFWAVILRDQRRGTAGGAVLALFAGAGQSTALGALLTLTSRPSYPVHAATTAGWNLTPLEDQQLAGLVMWVVGGTGYALGALLVLARVLRREHA